jgi:hypothetical protein
MEGIWAIWGVAGGLFLGPGLLFLGMFLTGMGLEGGLGFLMFAFTCLLIGIGIRLLGERQGVALDLATGNVFRYTGWLGHSIMPVVSVRDVASVSIRYEQRGEIPHYCVEFRKADGTRVEVAERRLKFAAMNILQQVSDATGLPTAIEC